MLKRLFDILASLTGLILTAPVLFLALVAVRLSSPGPVLYRAQRVGRNGERFVLHKVRTMHHTSTREGTAITASADSRIFPVGAFLRTSKIDELPQLFDVLRGKMSIVGPRPEDPEIVAAHYGAVGWKTLRVLPGLSSPGAIFYYLHADEYLAGKDPEAAYIQDLLPRKLALEAQYLRTRSFVGDLGVILKTVVTIVLISAGNRELAVRLARLPAQEPARDLPPAQLGPNGSANRV